MKKILIINQHKGTVSEVKKYLENYRSVVDPYYFDQILIIDKLTDTDAISTVTSELKMEYGNECNIICKGNGHGLSVSRRTALDWVFQQLRNDDYSHILFGCTNSSYIQLGRVQYNKISKCTNYPILVPCIYDRDPFTRDRSQLKESTITFDEWFNNEKKPDYTLVFPTKLLLDNFRLVCVNSEMYTPEDLLLYNCTRDTNKLKIYKPGAEGYFIKAWYNPTGLSMTFNRQSMLSNRNGFYLRAKLFLEAYCKGELQLTYNRLKWLVYDYVTLAQIDKYHLFKGTIIEPLIQWALFHWVKDPGHIHKLEFKEDLRDGD